MKKKSASQFTFFNLRVLIGLFLVLTGAFLALMGFGDQALQPARATYAGLGGQALTHVAITTTPLADVYVILAGTNPDGSASFRILVNPLVSWIWAGGIVIILGVILGNAGLPRRAPVPVLVPAAQAP